MLFSTRELFLIRPTWTDSNFLAAGILVFFLLSLLWQDWKSPIPFGALIGLIAGSLVGIGLGIANSDSQWQLIQETKELMAVGTVVGFLLGLMFKLLFESNPSEVQQMPSDSNRPPNS
jgi:Na+/proline symporter